MTPTAKKIRCYKVVKMNNKKLHAKNLLRLLFVKRQKFDNETHTTQSSVEQSNTENKVEVIFLEYLKNAEFDLDLPQLLSKTHILYLNNCLKALPDAYECLDASQPWLCYWIVHSLSLLRSEIEETQVSYIAQFLARCQYKDGGFGGGPGQIGHLATTYAAINALCILGTEEAYNVIDREKLLMYLWSVRCPNGAFRVHKGGEIDIRGVYCAVSIAKLTNIYTIDLFKGSAEWIIRCQTYEGGFSGVPGMEAHGGYSFCGVAALALLSSEHMVDMKSLLRWTTKKQMGFEGGFQGRTNKLVDSCYSFWQGAVIPILQTILSNEIGNNAKSESWLFQEEALQEFILICCQNKGGGLLDKPSKTCDLYHTCYALSGLSVAQTSLNSKPRVLGNAENKLATIDPIFNIEIEKLKLALQYFNQKILVEDAMEETSCQCD